MSVPSAPGPPQNPLKNHLRKRCPKALKNNPRVSNIDPKISKKRARGPPAGISDAVLSNPGFERLLHEFHGFSVSGASQNHQKAIQTKPKKYSETVYRNSGIQALILIRKWWSRPPKKTAEIIKNYPRTAKALTRWSKGPPELPKGCPGSKSDAERRPNHSPIL